MYIFFAFTPFANYIYSEILIEDRQTESEREKGESFKELHIRGALAPPSQHSQREIITKQRRFEGC